MNHFFDVGANNGSTFDRFIAKSPEFDGWTVWCFEPSPREWPSLFKKAEQYSTRYKIVLCPFGLGNSFFTARFYQQNLSEGDTFIPHAVDFHKNPAIPLGEKYQLMAASVPFSSFVLDNTSIGDSITMKLDCEGAEFDILNDLLLHPKALNRFKKIMVEWHVVNRIDYERETQRIVSAYERCGHKLYGWGY